MNILVRGGTPFRLLERQEQHAYPAGTVELLGDQQRGRSREETGGEARERYADLLESLTEERPEQTRSPSCPPTRWRPASTSTWR